MISLSQEKTSAKSLDEKIIPMINVIFLLLMFFMVAGDLSEVVRQDIILPDSASDQISGKDEFLLVMTNEGELFWQDQLVAINQLQGIFSSSVMKTPSRLRLKADARAKAVHLVPVLEELTRLGVGRVALVTMNLPDNTR